MIPTGINFPVLSIVSCCCEGCLLKALPSNTVNLCTAPHAKLQCIFARATAPLSSHDQLGDLHRAQISMLHKTKCVYDLNRQRSQASVPKQHALCAKTVCKPFLMSSKNILFLAEHN